MYKVVIIDDEPIIRKGIKNIINWKQLDCEVCAEASDGIKGIDFVREYLPEIILTDICMPGIDGLNMIKQVKSIVPNSKVIIITGYREFDYVHEAIRCGAFDFLLKPTRLEKLTEVLGSAVEGLNEQKIRHSEVDKFKLLFEQSIPLLKEKFLFDIVFEINNNEDEILEKMKLFNIHINNFVFLVIENEFEENMDKTQYDKHLYKFGIINSFEEILAEKYKVHIIMLNSNRIGFIIQTSTQSQINLAEVVENSIYLHEMVNNTFGFAITIAVSTVGTTIYELPEKLKECQYSLEYRSYLGNNSVIQYSDLNSFFKYDDYSRLERYKKQLLEGIKAGNEGIAKACSESISDFISSNSININYLKNFYYSTLSAINNIRLSVLAVDVEKKHEESKDIAGLITLIDESGNTGELNLLLQEVALKIASKVNSLNNKSIKVILRKAIDYINGHYAQPVTLNEVAEHTFVTTFYISRMFKKELGTSFVDYLNEIRVEKAKELLKDVKYKSYEVASLVGISDPHYFSRLFKKYSGVSPSEYRLTLKPVEQDILPECPVKLL